MVNHPDVVVKLTAPKNWKTFKTRRKRGNKVVTSSS